jgi:hypothetical protein
MGVITNPCQLCCALCFREVEDDLNNVFQLPFCPTSVEETFLLDASCGCYYFLRTEESFHIVWFFGKNGSSVKSKKVLKVLI